VLRGGLIAFEDKKRGARLAINLNVSLSIEGELEAKVACAKGSEKDAERFLEKVETRYINESILRGRKIDASGRFIDLKRKTWRDIVLESEIVNKIKDNVLYPIENIGLFEKFGLRTSRGILLEGPPGVGKTLLGAVIRDKLYIYPCHIERFKRWR
jgi:SpoVK/Ycf46/Vps4 family AAA+-type ATPase